MKSKSIIDLRAIAQVKRHMRGKLAKREILICTDINSQRKIGISLGSSINARMNSSMLMHLRNNGRCDLWHNHPSYGSLSLSDWRISLNWPGINRIIALNESGTIFKGCVKDRSRIMLLSKPFYAKGFSSVPGAIKITHFENAVSVASSRLMSTGNNHLNLYLSPFGTHVVNIAMNRLGIVNYSFLFSKIDTYMMKNAIVEKAMNDAVDDAYRNLKIIY